MFPIRVVGEKPEGKEGHFFFRVPTVHHLQSTSPFTPIRDKLKFNCYGSEIILIGNDGIPRTGEFYGKKNL